jgi:O-antigen/teichoic acid export membrane protein
MLIRHSAFYVVGKLVPGLMGMATTALLTHLLDPGSYGLYGLALVVMTFGQTMIFDWLGVSLLRFYETRRGDPLVFSTIIQIFLLLVVGTGILTVVAWAFGLFARQETVVLAAGIVMMWMFSWFELAGRFEIANFRPARYVMMNLGRGFFVIIGAAGAAWLTHSAVWTAVGTAIGTAGGALFGGFQRWSIGPSHFDKALARSLLAFGLPMAASLALSSLVTTGTRTLLAVMDSATALGIYTAALMMIQNAVNMTSAGIASAAYQLAVRAVESGDPLAARRQLMQNGTLLVAVIAPATVGMAVTAHGIAATVVGAEFVPGVTALTPWMAATAFFAAMRAHHFDHAFHLGRRPFPQVIVAAVAAILSMGLSALLIPSFGAIGVGIGTTVAMVVGCVHSYLAGRSAYRVPIPVAGTIRVALACAVMAAVVLMIPYRGLGSFILQIAAGAATYGVAAFALDVMGVRRTARRILRVQMLALRARPSRQGG